MKIANNLNLKLSNIGILKKGIPGKIFDKNKEIDGLGFQHF